MVGAGSLAGRFGKLGCPGGGGSADGLSLIFGLNSLACTPTMLGLFAVSPRTAPSAGSVLWMRFLALSIGVVVVAAVVAGFVVAVVAGLLFVVVAAGFAATFAVAGLVVAAVAGLTGVVATGLAATVVAGLLGAVVAGLAAVVVVGARTTGAGVGAARTTGADARTGAGAGAARTTGAGAARTTGAGAGAEVVVFLVSAKAGCDNASAASSTPARAISVSNAMTFPQKEAAAANQTALGAGLFLAIP